MTGLDLTTDVLIVGGGPAATWAALRTARAGADVVLADKGYCGRGRTPGALPAAGPPLDAPGNQSPSPAHHLLKS
ncbi:FAD-dependent oxidoreductase [Streptomyces sp. NPDC001514]